MSTAPAIDPNPLFTQMITSDELYFRLAADVDLREDCEVACAPGFTHVAAGAVVQAVRFRGGSRDANEWVNGVETHMKKAGARFCRIYLSESSPALSAAFLQRGYRARKEFAFCLSAHQLEPVSSVRFHRAQTEDHWNERLKMHEEDSKNSDGYDVDPKGWRDLIRAKCAGGVKESYLIEHGGQICGSVAVIQMRDLVRVKNLLIRPAFRRKGIAHQVIRELSVLARSRHLSTLGAFGIAGEAGTSLYRAVGFSSIGYQTEWCRRLMPGQES